jgi:hypothetical protein
MFAGVERNSLRTTRRRRVGFAIRLVATRLANQRATAAIVATGIALAAAAFAATLGGSVVAQDRKLAQVLAALPVTDRTVQATHYGVVPEGTSYEALDESAHEAVASLTGRQPIRVVQFRVLRLGADRAVLAAADDVRGLVRLESGRRPRSCSPTRCEVVVVAGRGRVTDVGAPFAVVGRGRLASALPFGALGSAHAGPSGETLGQERAPDFLVANGVRALAELPTLASIYRTQAWIAPLERRDLRVWEVDSFAREVARTRSSLRAQSSGFDITAPVAELVETAEAGRAAGNRLRLVAGEAAALLAAFALFVAAAMRQQERAAWSRLTWFGARRWQIGVLAGSEAALLTVIGVAFGWALGTLVTVLVARVTDVPAAAVVAEGLFSREALVGAAAITTVTALALLAALAIEDVRVGGKTISALDVAGAGALAAVVLVVGRGTGDVSAGSDEGATGTLLVVLPALALFVVAVATARVLVPLLQGSQRLFGRSTAPLRLAALSLARSPGRATMAVTFLVVSLGLAVFTLLYRSTLVGAIADQASYAVPHDLLVREKLGGEGLVAPLEAAPIERYESLAPGMRAIPIVRQEGSASRLVGIERFTLVGMPAAELRRLDGWRNDFASTPAATIAERLTPRERVAIGGAVLSADTSTLRLPIRATGDDVQVFASLLLPDGSFTTIRLGLAGGGRTVVLRAAVPARLHGAELLGFEFRRALGVEAHAQGNAPILRGIAMLGPLAARTAAGRRVLVADYGEWTGVGGARRAPAFGPNAVDYLIGAGEDAFFRARQPTDERPVAAAVSPGLAALADDRGELAVRVPAGILVFRVVATIDHFPSVYDTVVVADRDALLAALNAIRPGTGQANEIWLDASRRSADRPIAEALERPPFDVLAIESREALLEALRSEPLARGTLIVLVAGMAVALVLGIVGVLLLVVTDSRGQSRELFDLETQGAAPPTLRRHVRLRLALVAAPGVLGGLLAGMALSTIVVDFVALTANEAAPKPPLVLRLDWPAVVLTVGGFLAAVLALATVHSGRSFRAPYPEEDPR